LVGSKLSLTAALMSLIRQMMKSALKCMIKFANLHKWDEFGLKLRENHKFRRRMPFSLMSIIS